MNRRTLLASTSVLAFTAILAGCTGTTSAVTFASAKAYADDAVAAVLAAAQEFAVGPPKPSAAQAATVAALSSALETAKTALDATTTVSNWQAGAIEVLAMVQQLSPMVAPFLGAAGPYLPLAIAMIQAFIQSLPPPVNAPVVPPAALARKAMEYHHR